MQALKEFDLYDDTHRLRITVSNMKNGNSRKKLEEIKTSVLKALSNIHAAPGAQFAPVPPRHQIVSTSVSITPLHASCAACLYVAVGERRQRHGEEGEPLSNMYAAPGAQFAPVPPRHQIVSTSFCHTIACVWSDDQNDTSQCKAGGSSL